MINWYVKEAFSASRPGILTHRYYWDNSCLFIFNPVSLTEYFLADLICWSRKITTKYYEKKLLTQANTDSGLELCSNK